MKFLSTALVLLSVLPAHASYISLSCSSATSSVIWEEGNNSNLAHLRYDGFVTGILEVEREKLKIETKEQFNIRQRLLSNCGAHSTMTTFAMRIEITPADDYPHVLQSYFPDNKIVADVICEKVESTEADCRP
ncbi:MAG: hypothetical protein ACJ76H_11230 [Bacteriovoracaceae bacterium]